MSFIHTIQPSFILVPFSEFKNGKWVREMKKSRKFIFFSVSLIYIRQLVVEHKAEASCVSVIIRLCNVMSGTMREQ